MRNIQVRAVHATQEAYRIWSKDHSAYGLYGRNNRNGENLTLRQINLCGQYAVFLWYSNPAAERPTCCNPLESNIAYCMSGRRNALWFLIPGSRSTLIPPLR
jgi:hypothetical protein